MGDIPIHLRRKQVRHLRLRIDNEGSFHLSIPWMAPDSLVRSFLEQQRDWVEKQHRAAAARLKTRPNYRDGEEIRWWGASLVLRVTEYNPEGEPVKHAKASVSGGEILLEVPPGTTVEKRRQTVDRLRKTSLETRLAALLPRWARVFDVEPGQVRVRRMKSRWGSCNPRTRVLTFNLELSAKDPKYLEYVVAHELTHYFFSNHGTQFHALLASKLPAERRLRRELNRS